MRSNIKWVNYDELKSFKVESNQTFKVVAWPLPNHDNPIKWGIVVQTNG